jgi:hypothetical protein
LLLLKSLKNFNENKKSEYTLHHFTNLIEDSESFKTKEQAKKDKNMEPPKYDSCTFLEKSATHIKIIS